MKTLTYGEKTLPLENPTQIRYSILVDEVSFMSGHILCEYYGVQVEMGDQCEQIRYVTTSQKAIQELLELLEKGDVTPVSMYDVVNDWVQGR